MLDFSSLAESLKAILWPQRCIFCSELIFWNKEKTCDRCKNSLPYVTGRICKKCGCSKDNCSCTSNILYYDSAAAPFYYEDSVKKALTGMKFSQRKEYAEAFSEYMLKTLSERYKDEKFDVILCVPLHKKDRRKRGYNQSELLSRYISEKSGIPYKDNVLEKIYRTKMQMSQKGIERSGNLLGAFSVRNGADLEDKSILLIDDIKTTGATVSECGKMLYLAGAKEVCVLSCAVTRKRNKDRER